MIVGLLLIPCLREELAQDRAGQFMLGDQKIRQHLELVIDREKVLFDDLTVLSNDHLEENALLSPEELTMITYDLSHSF